MIEHGNQLRSLAFPPLPLLVGGLIYFQRGRELMAEAEFDTKIITLEGYLFFLLMNNKM